MMGRAKDQWLEATGGLSAFESPEQRRARYAEIAELESRFKSGGIGLDEVEAVQRRLCQLKGKNFEDYEPSD